MGKKKNTAKQLTPDEHKEIGNKAFAAQNFEEAVNQYSLAIDRSGPQLNHIYFSNRANAYLSLKEYQKCVDDCKQAIQIEPAFVKAHYRMVRALFNMDLLEEAKQAAETALAIDPSNEMVVDMLKEIEEDMALENVMPGNEKERAKDKNLV